ncbi:hypothetical protein C2W62_53830 [Candidatus Entotheonella serta]|nr:hypothetical protein C2W62_53830 [Candidatus Entotheonella serta]
MLAINRFMIGIVKGSKATALSIVKKELHIVIEGAVICLQKVSKKGGVGGPVALASGYENTYPLPNRPE